jgi:hypothetical protein
VGEKARREADGLSRTRTGNPSQPRPAVCRTRFRASTPLLGPQPGQNEACCPSPPAISPQLANAPSPQEQTPSDSRSTQQLSYGTGQLFTRRSSGPQMAAMNPGSSLDTQDSRGHEPKVRGAHSSMNSHRDDSRSSLAGALASQIELGDHPQARLALGSTRSRADLARDLTQERVRQRARTSLRRNASVLENRGSTLLRAWVARALTAHKTRTRGKTASTRVLIRRTAVPRRPIGLATRF